MKLFKKDQKNEAKKEKSNDKQYITENMGEVTVKNNGFKYVYGKYNSEEIQIANLGLVSSKFEENFDFFISVINQYGKIHEISKKAIIENFDNDENIRRFFFPYNLLEEEKLFELLRNKGTTRMFLKLSDSVEPTEQLLKFCGIEVFEGFDINKAVDKLKYPRLYFVDNSFRRYGVGKLEYPSLYFTENPFRRYGDEKIYFEVQYCMSDESDLVLEVFMDRNFKIYCFDCSRLITVNLK